MLCLFVSPDPRPVIHVQSRSEIRLHINTANTQVQNTHLRKHPRTQVGWETRSLTLSLPVTYQTSPNGETRPPTHLLCYHGKGFSFTSFITELEIFYLPMVVNKELFFSSELVSPFLGVWFGSCSWVSLYNTETINRQHIFPLHCSQCRVVQFENKRLLWTDSFQWISRNDSQIRLQSA